ncbi:MAG: hypothetical protein E7429_01090, partial [Ruminococcaceae bacterium]|nr:hypothetical protein [Oscillospiraceae bacterium]
METNMERVRDTTMRLLDMPITKTSCWPEVAQHPFTNTGFYHWRDEKGEFHFGTLDNGTEAYKKWKSKYKEFI